MNIELSRFRVKEGMSPLVDEWMSFLNDNMEDVLLTLDDEKMYVESIFREYIDGAEYLYWYSIQGDGGQNISESQSRIDMKHLEYWDKCIDEREQKDMKLEVSMIPKHIALLMNDCAGTE